MSARARSVAAGSVLIAAAVIAAVAEASWERVVAADDRLDLLAAEVAAVDTVASDPTGPAAVAAVGWWLENLEVLSNPRAIVDAGAGEAVDPEVELLTDRVAGLLVGEPPAGALAAAELAGPFGVFDILDLERDAVPPDSRLPPLPTPWRGPAEPFRLRLESADGWIGPPPAMTVPGVFLAGWWLRTDEALSGWLVVEVRGDARLELDGSEVARVRRAGLEDPGTVWLRVDLAPGVHRLRALMSSRSRPEVRVTLHADGDATATLVDAPDAGTTPSTASVEEPPAARALLERLGETPTIDGLLLAAAVARGRRDLRAEREHLETAVALDPDDARVRLDRAVHFLSAPTGADGAFDLQRAGDEARLASSSPASLLVEHAVAQRQRRRVDAERLLDRLVEEHSHDPRVLRASVDESIRRGWLGEAERAAERLAERLPGSRVAAKARLDVLEALGRFGDRLVLLVSEAARRPFDAGLVAELAGTCEVETAISIIDRLREAVSAPELDLEIVRLLARTGELDRARRELDVAAARWGHLPDIDQLRLLVSSPEQADAALEAALGRTPSDLDLRALAWRGGLEPFWVPYRRTADEALAERESATTGPDGRPVPAEIVLDQAVERIFSDGSSLYYYHGVTRVNTPAGVRRASRLQQLPGALRLTARVVKADGRVVIPAELAAEGAVTISGVEPGDVVEEEFVAAVPATGASRKGHLPPYVYRFADTERAFGLSEYVLLVPSDIELRVAGMTEGLEVDAERVGDITVRTWRADGVDPVPMEPYAPPVQELLPWVTYGFGVTWQDVGDAIRDRALTAAVPTRELRDFTREHLVGSDAASGLRSLVAAVCREVEAGDQVLDLSSGGGQSFSRRFGNRLGIVTTALLDAGWEVDLALARPRPLAGTYLEVPTLDAFTVPLLRARAGTEWVWLDIAEEAHGVDGLRPILQGGDALLLPLSDLSRDVELLAELPQVGGTEVEERIGVTADLGSDGSAHLVFTMDLRGGSAERMLDRMSTVPPDRRDAIFAQMATGVFPGGTDVQGKLTTIADGARVELELELPGACEVVGDRMECRGLVIARPLAPNLASLPERRFPLLLELPIRQRLVTVIDHSAGWRLERPPRRVEAEWGKLVEELYTDGDRVRSEVLIELPAQRVSPDEYSRFARFCQAVDELATRPPVLERAP